MDQTLSNIQTLFHAQKIVPNMNVYLLGADCLSWLVHPGRHHIEVPQHLQQSWCSLIPIGQKCSNITTSGLKWNLSMKH